MIRQTAGKRIMTWCPAHRYSPDPDCRQCQTAVTANSIGHRRGRCIPCVCAACFVGHLAEHQDHDTSWDCGRGGHE